MSPLPPSPQGTCSLPRLLPPLPVKPLPLPHKLAPPTQAPASVAAWHSSRPSAEPHQVKPLLKTLPWLPISMRRVESCPKETARLLSRTSCSRPLLARLCDLENLPAPPHQRTQLMTGTVPSTLEAGASVNKPCGVPGCKSGKTGRCGTDLRFLSRLRASERETPQLS